MGIIGLLYYIIIYIYIYIYIYTTSPPQLVWYCISGLVEALSMFEY